MSEKREDGGRAFPVPDGFVDPGMSLRDYFAAQAIMGLMAQPDGWGEEAAASKAYRVADALLKARLGP